MKIKALNNETMERIAKTISGNMDCDIRKRFINNDTLITDMIFFSILNMTEIKAYDNNESSNFTIIDVIKDRIRAIIIEEN